jgi:hypothetical protein
MSDIEHLPVRPNMNNAYAKNAKPRQTSEVSRPSLDDVNKDPSMQRFFKKKTDALEIDSIETKEEKKSKESAPKNFSRKEEGFSWVIIALAIVIIILIIIVIYYVLKYSQVSGNDIIPASVVKPTPDGILGAMFDSSQKKELVTSEPSKKDLDSVLNRLSTITEVSEDEHEEELEEIKKETPVEQVVEKNIIESDSDQEPELNIDIEKDTGFLLSDNFTDDNEDENGNSIIIDTDMIEEIVNQKDI